MRRELLPSVNDQLSAFILPTDVYFYYFYSKADGLKILLTFCWEGFSVNPFFEMNTGSKKETAKKSC